MSFLMKQTHRHGETATRPHVVTPTRTADQSSLLDFFFTLRSQSRERQDGCESTLCEVPTLSRRVALAALV